MRFTSQEEYGLRCLLQLARASEHRLTIAEIAEREGLTAAYVAKLLGVLHGAGLVTSIRGRGGGYRLSRDPATVNLATIMEALDGRLYTNDFCGRHAGNEPTCVHDVNCTIRSLWRALDGAVQETLARTTLRDLCGTERTASARFTAATPAPPAP
jgi:Rrf2 family protein